MAYMDDDTEIFSLDEDESEEDEPEEEETF